MTQDDADGRIAIDFQRPCQGLMIHLHKCEAEVKKTHAIKAPPPP